MVENGLDLLSKMLVYNPIKQIAGKIKLNCPYFNSLDINNIFGSGTANDHIGQLWFKKSGKGKESLEDEECRGQPSEGDND